MPLAVEAQQAGIMYRIGFRGATSVSANPHIIEAFGKGLRDLGHVEGQTVVIEYRFAEGQYERLPGLAADLVRLKMDVIFAPATLNLVPMRGRGEAGPWPRKHASRI